MKIIYPIIAFVFCLTVNAQHKTTVEHFDSIVSTSNTFSNKKIIKIRELETFKTALVKAQDSLKNSIKALNTQIDNRDAQINSLTSEKDNLKEDLDKTKKSVDTISLLGVPLLKNTYHIIVWVIIFLLIITIVVIVIRTRSVKLINNELKENLENLNKEFDSYKLTSLEKQQKLGRALLDVKKKLNPNK